MKTSLRKNLAFSLAALVIAFLPLNAMAVNNDDPNLSTAGTGQDSVQHANNIGTKAGTLATGCVKCNNIQNAGAVGGSVPDTGNYEPAKVGKAGSPAGSSTD